MASKPRGKKPTHPNQRWMVCEEDVCLYADAPEGWKCVAHAAEFRPRSYLPKTLSRKEAQAEIDEARARRAPIN